MLRKLLLVFVVALPLLLIAFAVVMAFYAVVTSGQDLVAARVTWWIGMAIFVLLTIDVVGLVGILGLRAVIEDERERA